MWQLYVYISRFIIQRQLTHIDSAERERNRKGDDKRYENNSGATLSALILISHHERSFTINNMLYNAPSHYVADKRANENLQALHSRKSDTIGVISCRFFSFLFFGSPSIERKYKTERERDYKISRTQL